MQEKGFFPFIKSIENNIYLIGVMVYLFLATLFCSALAIPQENPLANNAFRFSVWPAVDSIITGASNPASMTTLLVDSWYKGHLPTYAGKTLQILLPESDSLKTYTQQIEANQPECIEGDSWFVEREINKQNRLYIPILMEKPSLLPKSLLIFRSKQNIWQGVLGVVHPSMSTGGKDQIEFWEKQNNRKPDWVAFYSAEETLRHLLIGSVESIAVPANALESFLAKENRLDLLQRLNIISLPETQSNVRIFLRKDLYDQLLFRTLIGETWLRNYFPQSFFAVSFAEPGQSSFKK